jgi:hypothetical protein
VKQFNYQFKNEGDAENAEIIDRFPHTQRFFHEKKERKEEIKRENSPTRIAERNKTSLMDKIKSSISSKNNRFGDSTFSPLNVSQGVDNTARQLLDQTSGTF